MQAPAVENRLSTGCQRHCFTGFSAAAGGGALAGRAQLCCSCSRSQCQEASARELATAILNWVPVQQSLYVPAVLRCQPRHFTLGTPVWSAGEQGLCLWHPTSKWTWRKHKGKEEKFRRYYPGSVFIPQELFISFTSDKSLLCLLFCSSSEQNRWGGAGLPL